jgi:uridine kinase
VLVEGIFTLCFAGLRSLYALSVYVDTPDDLCFERRLQRDVVDRGRTPESVRRQYEATVRPASMAWIRPSASYAGLILDGAGALDWKVERVLTELRKQGLFLPD